MRILTAMIQGRLMFDLVAGVAALLGLGVMLMTDAVGAHVNADADDHPLVELDTSLGPIVLELDRTRAPITVANFLQYVDAGFYDNTIFHRVIPGFMIQGGGMDDAMREKPTNPPIRNEASNGLSNKRGTIAMARTNDPNSATAQFFINLVDNGSLNPRPGSAGYAVFGKVVSGMDVVDAIAQARTASRGPHDDVPVKPIYIKSARRKAKP